MLRATNEVAAATKRRRRKRRQSRRRRDDADEGDRVQERRREGVEREGGMGWAEITTKDDDESTDEWSG